MWTHLKNIQFPDPGPNAIVDMLIGVDYADLHYSIKDVRGRPGEPLARLTPLDWTCVGPPSGLKGGDLQTSFVQTYFIQEHREDSDEISGLLRKFWDVESSGTLKDAQVLNSDDKLALEKVQKSIKYVEGRYQVDIPWKNDEPELPDNYDMALRRLFNTEKRLLKSPEIGEAYSNSITQYLEKGYIRQIEPAETKPSKKWYLPHFPVLLSGRIELQRKLVSYLTRLPSAKESP